MKVEIFDIIASARTGDRTVEDATNEVLRLFNVVGRSELLRDYFAWHEEKGYVSHKPSDIDEFLNEQ